MEEMKARKTSSEREAAAAISDGRRLVQWAEAFGVYKRDVMEKAPASDYAKHVRDDFYAPIRPDDLPGDDWVVLCDRFREVSAYLRGAVGAERAGDWWATRQSGETNQWLRAAMSNAETVARGVAMTNWVADPGFESRGAKLTPPGPRDISSAATAKDAGVGASVGEGTAGHLELTDAEAHAGKWSVMMAECQSASIGERMAAKSGERYRLSVWVKQNDMPGALCQVMFIPRSGDGLIRRTTATIPWKPGEWQEIAMDVVVPQGANNFIFTVLARAQPTGAKLWADDFEIRKYPDGSI
jgi:hypothetical protein